MRLLTAIEHGGRTLRKAVLTLPDHFSGCLALHFIDGHLSRKHNKVSADGLVCPRCGQSDLTVVSVTVPVAAADE